MGSKLKRQRKPLSHAALTWSGIPAEAIEILDSMPAEIRRPRPEIWARPEDENVPADWGESPQLYATIQRDRRWEDAGKAWAAEKRCSAYTFLWSLARRIDAGLRPGRVAYCEKSRAWVDRVRPGWTFDVESQTWRKDN